jgi:diguanylate cyclase (GGDEF)-like protein/hemerythrin-like metal-binding protein/PAS domain S-box-containing protein
MESIIMDGWLSRGNATITPSGTGPIMEIFPWNNNFETGLRQIDDQHRTLVNLVNRLASYLNELPESEELGPIFDELADYAVHHFEDEEAIWHQYLPGDEWVDLQCADHEQFVIRIHQMRQEARDIPAAAMVRSMLLYLARWLAFHILESDRSMARVVVALQGGASLEEARQQATGAVNEATRGLIESILALSENLADRTLSLMAENAERRKVEAQLKLVNLAFQNTQEATCITDAETRIIRANPMFCHGLGLDESKIAGQHLKTLKPVSLPDAEISVEETVWRAAREQGYWNGDIVSRNADGLLESEWLSISTLRGPAGEITNYVVGFFNISQLTSRMKVLQRMAQRDALTGLPNRSLLADRLELALTEIARYGNYLAICFMDLDGFKAINDRLGHDAGDQVLKEISHRVQTSLRRNDTVARMGGDEFVILLGHLKDPADCESTLRRLLAQVEQPIDINGQPVAVTASIGVTIYPTDIVDAETLLHHADEAMYQAKRLGKSRYFLYQTPA